MICGRKQEMSSTTIPVTRMTIVVRSQPFHSLRMMPHTLLKTTFSAMRIQNESVVSTGEEALAQRESEELAVPQCAGKKAAEEVAPYLSLAVVAPSVVVLVLPQTVDRGWRALPHPAVA